MQDFLQDASLWCPFKKIHGQQQFATYNRNYWGKVIDAIVCLVGLLPIVCSYDPEGKEVSSGHVQSWANFNHDQLFGEPINQDEAPIDCLKTDGPRVVDRYTKLYYSSNSNSPKRFTQIGSQKTIKYNSIE